MLVTTEPKVLFLAMPADQMKGTLALISSSEIFAWFCKFAQYLADLPRSPGKTDPSLRVSHLKPPSTIFGLHTGWIYKYCIVQIIVVFMK